MRPAAVLARAGVLSLVVALSACGYFRKETTDQVPTRLIVVLPFDTAPAADKGEQRHEPKAGDLVTAQLYRVLASQTEYRFVADLVVQDTLATPELRRAVGQTERALALATALGADAVITGQVNRFDPRVGTAHGATQGASVAFEMRLLNAGTGAEIWRGVFDETQTSADPSWFQRAKFWEPGPHWLTASELAGRGMDQLWGSMTAHLEAQSPIVQPESAEEPPDENEDDGWF
ncbi:MAG: hypothetical protein AB7V27_08315 [Candidatus Binatia bacterium]